MADMYKIKREMGTIEQACEEINNKFGEKYKVEFHKADTGLTKFFTGETQDYISIKKNAYHGIIIGLSPADDRIDFRTMTYGTYTPNKLVDQVIGRTGIIDILVAKLIWGSAKEFYADIETYITGDLEGTKVDMGLTNSIKQMMKGKTVMDD